MVKIDIEDNLILPFTEEELKQQQILQEQEKEYLEEIRIANLKWEKVMGKIEIDGSIQKRITWSSEIQIFP
jgi:hypothetical protein